MSIYELKILFDLDPNSKSKVLDKYAKKCRLGYFFVDSEDGQCYLFDRYGKEKDISLIHEINKEMIPRDIKKIVIPNNVVSIGYRAFSWCSKLTSITIPNSVTRIWNWVFDECNRLTNVTIPDSVMSIGDCAFMDCNSLTSMTMPNNVTSIGQLVFYGCNRLDKIVFKNKRIDQVKSMKYYPFGIKDKSIIKAELN